LSENVIYQNILNKNSKLVEINFKDDFLQIWFFQIFFYYSLKFLTKINNLDEQDMNILIDLCKHSLSQILGNNEKGKLFE